MEWIYHAHSGQWQTFESVFLSSVVGQMEHPKMSSRIWNIFIYTYISYKTTIYSMDDNFVSRGLQRANRKISKFITLYHRKNVEGKTKAVYIFHAVSNSRVHCVSLTIPCKQNWVQIKISGCNTSTNIATSTVMWDGTLFFWKVYCTVNNTRYFRMMFFYEDG
jgi:hypothetical protein